jgi:hypothetical protein
MTATSLLKKGLDNFGEGVLHSLLKLWISQLNNLTVSFNTRLTAAGFWLLPEWRRLCLI